MIKMNDSTRDDVIDTPGEISTFSKKEKAFASSKLYSGRETIIKNGEIPPREQQQQQQQKKSIEIKRNYTRGATLLRKSLAWPTDNSLHSRR